MVAAILDLGEIRLRVVQGTPAAPCLFPTIGRYCITVRPKGRDTMGSKWM
jgi:hypothetical protein